MAAGWVPPKAVGGLSMPRKTFKVPTRQEPDTVSKAPIRAPGLDALAKGWKRRFELGTAQRLLPAAHSEV